jgi:hypothetical protein
MSATAQSTHENMGWWKATKIFFSNKDEVGGFLKFLTWLGKFSIIALPIAVADDILDGVPIVDWLTIGDDILIPFLFVAVKVLPFYMVFRIWWIRMRVNHLNFVFSR